MDGARRLLAETAGHDEELKRRLAVLREQLRRQIARDVSRVQGEFDRRFDELAAVGRDEQAAIAAEVAALEARLRAARELRTNRFADIGLLEEVQAALGASDASWNRPPPRPGVLARLRAFFARIAAWFARLFGRRKAVPTRPEGRPVTFAAVGVGTRSLGASEIGDALARLSSGQIEELETNVRRSLQAKERDLRREAEEKRRGADAQQRALEAERQAARERAQKESEQRLKAAEEQRLKRELTERGLVAEREGRLQVTYGLVERFARLVLEEESRTLPGDVRLSYQGPASTGVYEKARIRQSEEVAHLDLPSSLLAARMEGSRHLDERTSYIYREITSERVHVVLAFDKSGSMAEGEKLPAAKKALLALYIAVRKRHPDAIIDVVAFDNDVRVLDLLELWECPPGAFTNTAEALHTAHLLLRASRATRKEVYLVTDGLPEAYTGADGRVRSGNLDTAMDRALQRATELATVPGVKFSMILLKSEHPEYELAARRITQTLGGELVVTEPARLGVELLVRWARGTESTRRPVTAPATPTATVAPAARGPRGRRRKVDRRMGG
ncbi:MAG: hypothetical protein L3J87_01455 [Thermoplasmata archaeon]|nr:hypothetical protein [Thermoplasmata archaeon]